VAREPVGETSEVVAQQSLDQLAHALTIGRRRHEVRALLDRGQGVGDDDGRLARSQESVIVFGVADADAVVRRERQLGERDREPGCLVDAGWQHHHRALVEDDVELEAEIADDVEHDRLVRSPGRYDALADRERCHAARSQRRHEPLHGGLGQQFLLLAVGAVEHGAVLGHHPIEEVETRADGDEAVELAAGDEEQPAPRFLQAGQRGQRRLGDGAVVRDGAVVVACEGEVAHPRASTN
jgi:hypothetical protein